MANMETRTQLLEKCDVVEIALSANETGGIVESDLHVPQGCPALAITVTAGGPEGFRRGPRGASAEVQAPSGLNVELSNGYNGQQTYVIKNPEAGRWRIRIHYQPDCDAEINASALPRGWRERLGRGARWFTCKACKYAIKAFVIALLVQLGPAAVAAVGAEEILELAGTAFEALCEVLDLAEPARKELLGILGFVGDLIDNPVDRILQRICAWLRLCSPNTGDAADT